MLACEDSNRETASLVQTESDEPILDVKALSANAAYDWVSSALPADGIDIERVLDVGAGSRFILKLMLLECLADESVELGRAVLSTRELAQRYFERKLFQLSSAATAGLDSLAVLGSRILLNEWTLMMDARLQLGGCACQSRCPLGLTVSRCAERK